MAGWRLARRPGLGLDDRKAGLERCDEIPGRHGRLAILTAGQWLAAPAPPARRSSAGTAMTAIVRAFITLPLSYVRSRPRVAAGARARRPENTPKHNQHGHVTRRAVIRLYALTDTPLSTNSLSMSRCPNDAQKPIIGWPRDRIKHDVANRVRRDPRRQQRFPRGLLA